MARKHWHPSKCRVCGVGRSDGVIVSQKGYCMPHALERFHANTDQIRARNGPFYERWARRSLMAAQRALVAIERDAA